MKKAEKVARFLLIVLACTFGKLGLDFLSRVIETGLMAMWSSVHHLDMLAGTVVNYAAGVQVDTAHAVLEGLIIACTVLPLFRAIKPARGVVAKFAIILVGMVAFEGISFLSSLVQFVGNGIWAGITSSTPSVVLRNNVASTRWANIDYVFRFCEALLMLKILGIAQVRTRRKARRERG